MLTLLAAALIPATSSFSELPESWLGEWQGKVELVSPDKPVRPIAMSLTVKPLSKGTSWIIGYAEKDHKETRSYELVPMQDRPGRFLTDEKNGILLDNTLVGSVLYCHFKVQQTLIHARFELRNRALEIEMASYSTQSPQVSHATESGESVESYALSSVQRGTLRRTDKRKV